MLRSVAALPMSIWPQAMSRCRPSSDSERREPGQRVLGRDIGRRVAPRHMRRHRAVVDDAAAARVLLLHHAEGMLGAQKGAGQVGLHDAHPLLVGQLLETDAAGADPGIVEQEVDAAVGVFHRGEQQRRSTPASETSVGTTSVRGGGALPSVAVFFQHVAPAAGKDDVQPSSKSACAEARPMPLPAPVMTAIFVCSGMSISLS